MNEKGAVGKERGKHNMHVLEELAASLEHSMGKHENGEEKKVCKMTGRIKCSFGCSSSPLPGFSSSSYRPGSEGELQQLIFSSLIECYVGGGEDTYVHNIHINPLMN